MPGCLPVRLIGGHVGDDRLVVISPFIEFDACSLPDGRGGTVGADEQLCSDILTACESQADLVVAGNDLFDTVSGK